MGPAHGEILDRPDRLEPCIGHGSQNRAMRRLDLRGIAEHGDPIHAVASKRLPQFIHCRRHGAVGEHRGQCAAARRLDAVADKHAVAGAFPRGADRHVRVDLHDHELRAVAGLAGRVVVLGDADRSELVAPAKVHRVEGGRPIGSQRRQHRLGEHFVKHVGDFPLGLVAACHVVGAHHGHVERPGSRENGPRNFRRSGFDADKIVQQLHGQESTTSASLGQARGPPLSSTKVRFPPEATAASSASSARWRS